MSRSFVIIIFFIFVIENYSKPGSSNGSEFSHLIAVVLWVFGWEVLKNFSEGSEFTHQDEHFLLEMLDNSLRVAVIWSFTTLVINIEKGLLKVALGKIFHQLDFHLVCENEFVLSNTFFHLHGKYLHLKN